MKDHPMFAMRDHPEPIIDVTRPAVPQLTPDERALIVDALEGIAKAITESAAQVTNGDAGHPAIKPCEPVAADQFQRGDRVMCPVGPRVFSHYGPLASNGRIVAWVTLIRGENCGWRWWLIEEIRRPTAAELAERWPGVLP